MKIRYVQLALILSVMLLSFGMLAAQSIQPNTKDDKSPNQPGTNGSVVKAPAKPDGAQLPDMPATLPTLPGLSTAVTEQVAAAQPIPNPPAKESTKDGNENSAESAQPSPEQPVDQTTGSSTDSPIGSAGGVSSFATRNPRYLLRPGDVVDVTFIFAPEYNQTLPVQPDGFVNLKNAGDLKVAGMDLPQLRQELVKKYSSILKNPRIDVSLKDFEKPYFVAMGQVVRPGKYEMRGDTTVLEALGVAGGFTDAAKHSQVIVFRHISADWLETKKVDVKEILAGKREEDIHLQPGDLVYVPKSAFSKIKQFLPTTSMGTYVSPTH